MNKITYEHFQAEVTPYISYDKTLLDAGCGKTGINDLEAYRLRNKLCLGLDVSLDALKSRNCFNYKIQGLIDALPLKDNSVDVVISYLVFEHLETPELAVQEFFRILRKGGGVIITTNSIFHPMMLLSHLLPTKIRDWIKRHLLLIHDESFPTYYRFNSLGKIQRVMARMGFEKRFTTYSSTPYSGEKSSPINRLLSKLFIFYDRITNFRRFQFFKMNIVAHYVKR